MLAVYGDESGIRSPPHKNRPTGALLHSLTAWRVDRRCKRASWCIGCLVPSLSNRGTSVSLTGSSAISVAFSGLSNRRQKSATSVRVAGRDLKSAYKLTVERSVGFVTRLLPAGSEGSGEPWELAVQQQAGLMDGLWLGLG